MRVCTSCHMEMDLSEFSTNGKNGIHTSCKSCQASAARIKRQKNIESARQYERQQYAKNKDAKKASIAAYYQRNKDAIREAARARYAANSNAVKANNAEYRQANRDKVYAWNGTRRAAQRMAVPKWVDRGAITAIYAKARLLSQETGIRHHVDHIIPLNGDGVSGLHVPWNLQIITQRENLRKGARF